VFALTSTNTAVTKPVTLGLRLAGTVEVLSGLKEGEMVVVEGVQKLSPGAPVSLATNDSVTPYL
jgi:membrane fusion protein (multidrug efflux system)